jgi:hypothetical protein
MAWQNGKWLSFMDAYDHEAWNNTDRARYVFIVDVMRKEFESRKNYVCATVGTSLFLQKRFSRLATMPRFARFTARSLRPFIQTAISLVNKLRIY